MKLKLVEKRDEARETKSFFFESDTPTSYLPGQYFYFTLPKLNYPDDRGATRHFTISASPTEGTNLRFTTRIRQESGYKKTLDELPIGSTVEGEGPNGTFVLDENEKGPHIFIAGGIGITPFRSFIKFNIDKGLKIPMYLIYSNSDNDFAFKKEFDEWIAANSHIKIEYVDTSVSGHLDAAKLAPLFTTYDIPHTTFWFAGPPKFEDAIELELGKLKIPEDNIRSEKFTGY